MDTSNVLRLADVTHIVTRVLRQEVKEQQQEALSLDCMRYLSCLAETRGAPSMAHQIYVQRYPESFSAGPMRKSMGDTLYQKAAIAPGTSTDSVWAKPLIGVEQLAAGFLAIAHSQSLLGRLGLELIPANVKVPYQTADANFDWMPENFAIPTSGLAFSDGVTLPPTKMAGIVILTAEFVRLSSPGTARSMRNALTRGLNAKVDKLFLDPTVAAVAGKNPASVTNGTVPVVGTADLAASVKALITAFFAASPGSERPVLIANGGNAAAIRGQVPGFGLDVFASEAAGTNVVILDPARVFYADNGIKIDYSEHANLQMDSAPANPADASTVYVSLWQRDEVGFRLIRFVSWAAAPNAVKYMTTP